MAPTIDQVLAQHTDRLMAVPGVVGVAQGEKDSTPCITVMVAGLNDDLRSQIPDELDGYPVAITETGELTAR